MGILLKNADFVDPVRETVARRDLLIEHGRIAAMEADLPGDGHECIDLSGLYLCPGLVDMHVHFRDPGLTYKEDISTGSAAAAAGGFTAVACMPNTKPVLDTPEWMEYVLAQGKAAGLCHVHPIGAVTVGQQGKALTDFAALDRAGAVAFSDDGVPVDSALLVRNALFAARDLGRAVISHCEDREMVQNYAVNEGKISEKLGLPGRPAVAEDLMVGRDLLLSEDTGGHIHIAHVSTAGSVRLIREAKARGVNVTAETCPQYFTFTEDVVPEKGTLARINPPLRTEADRQAVLAAVIDGTLDCIVTDHAPHAPEEKARPLPDAPSGTVGLETSLAACYTALVQPGHLTVPELIRRMTVNPAAILGLRVSTNVGDPADLMAFDPKETWTVDADKLHSKSKNSVFAGETLTGKVKLTVLEGRVVYNAL